MTDTNGGAYIGGNVTVKAGKFVSGDSIEISVSHDKAKESYQPPVIIGELKFAGDGYPDGAILVRSLSGGTLRIPQGNYKLLQPVTQKNGMYVYIKV